MGYKFKMGRIFLAGSVLSRAQPKWANFGEIRPIRGKSQNPGWHGRRGALPKGGWQLWRAGLASALNLFQWFKEQFVALPDFVGAVDFGALSCATNVCKTLRKSGCSHFEEFRGKKAFDSPAQLGTTRPEVYKSVKNFMRHFWFNFGRRDAKSMAEARRAAVRPAVISGSTSAVIILLYVLLACRFFLAGIYYMMLSWALRL
jgi:hypothetical protein